jgi:hypothetical protein
MPYLYETHLHTSEASLCGKSVGYEYIKRYKDLGYTGIIITEHFYHGNCAINKRLPWDKWVRAFCWGYEKAREEGSRQGLDVFFGWEETFDGGDDYLVYGLDKEWLLDHPELIRWTRKQQYEEVRRYGGCVVQAHPFRQRDYINRVCLSSGCVDAVEAANAANQPSFDALAWRYAKSLNLPVIAGSDAHYAWYEDPDLFYGVYLDNKMESINDFAEAIRTDKKDSRRCNITELKIPEDRFRFYGDERIILPLDIRDNNDRPIKSFSELDFLKEFVIRR